MGLFLREATIDDAEILLEWRNDILTRNNSFSNDLIDLDTHLKWYQNKLADKNCYIYILMDTSERIGTIRIDQVNDIGEISYTISPAKRNMGYGKKIIELSESIVSGKVKALTGLVDTSNESSRKCFLGNHYAEFIGGSVACYIKLL